MAGTTETSDQTDGSAEIQGDLWGERARDWAEVLEGWNGWGIPLYRHILERVTVERAQGCSTWVVARVGSAASPPTGARMSRASMRRRPFPDRSAACSGGGVPAGDIEHVPWPDDSFDVVTGFNSFIFAAEFLVPCARRSAWRGPVRASRSPCSGGPRGAIDDHLRGGRTAPAGAARRR